MIKENKDNKFSSGITLVALVVTVVVLLILAGVSISAALGDGGILEQMQKEKTTTNSKVTNTQEQINNLYKGVSETV